MPATGILDMPNTMGGKSMRRRTKMRQRPKRRKKKQESHNMSKEYIYSRWSSLKMKLPEGHEWWDFSSFLEDVGRPPTRGHCLRKIDPKAPWGRDNWHWTTYKGRYDACTYTHNGESLHIGEWSERTGMSRNTILGRIRRGWSVSDAITLPVIKRSSK